MVFHLKDGYKWEPGSTIPPAQVLPVMFLSRCLTKVWAVKKLRTTIHSSIPPVIVLTDHSATKGIVEKTSLETSSTDRANKRLINASIYLSQ